MWSAAMVVEHGVRGEHRSKFVPAWLLAAGLITLLVPGAEYWWTAGGALVAWTPDKMWDRGGRQILSARERLLTSRAFAGVGTAHLVVWAGGGWEAFTLILLVTITVFAVRWWYGRRVRPPAAEPQIIARWRDEVVPVVPALDGRWTEFDEDRGTGVLELVASQAAAAAVLDADAEWALHQPAGTVTISADPRLSRRCVRVAFNDPGDGGRFRLWEGRTLQPNGQFTAAYAHGALPIYGRFWRPDGASHIAIVGPTGAGKGSIQRLIALEAGLSPDMFVIGVDGKQGGGLGYLRAGFGYLATSPDEWGDVIHGYMLAVEERSERYGDLGRDSFICEPGEPRLLLMIDDLPEVLNHRPSIGGLLKRITSQGRSLGAGLCTAKQKGDGPSYGSTATRANMLAGGWLWAGPAEDAQAKNTMLQTMKFDPSTLPQEPGWSALMGRHLTGQPVVPARTLWIPNRTDVWKAINEEGLTPEEACPFGTVEDWLERDAVIPDLNPVTLRKLGFTDTPAVVVGDPDHVAFTPPPAPAAPAPAARHEPAGWVKIRNALTGGPMKRGEIAKATGLNPRTVSDHLSKRDGKEVVSNPDTSEWSLAS